MATRLTDNAKTLLHLYQLALKGLPPDSEEPEGPFTNEEEQYWYDMLRSASALRGYVVVTYSAAPQTYTTTASDFSAKCGAGTVGASVSRTSSVGSSTISQAAANAKALAAAKAAALAAIVCPVVITPPVPTTYNGSYTTTASDFSAKCGAGTSGSLVTRTATSQASQADADTQAKNAALAAIVCPVVVAPPSFNTVLNPGESADVVTYNGKPGTRFKFNLPLPVGDPAPASMGLIYDNEPQGNVDFNGNIAGRICALEIDGKDYTTTFQNSDSVYLT